MALRLKKATPEFEEVEDDGDEAGNMWVQYDHPNPPMELLNPLVRTAEAMIDPRKAGSYHLKVSAARKFCKALGEGWGIENGRIMRTLPFGYAMSYKLANAEANEAFYKNLRNFLEANAKAPFLAAIKGVAIFPSDKRPMELKRGWLYISVPKFSQVDKVRGRYEGLEMNPDTLDGKTHPRRVPNGISDQNNALDFAQYSPQMIYLKVLSSTENMWRIVAAAIRNAQTAMDFAGGPTDLKGWLKDGAKSHEASRAGLLEKEKAKREKLQEAIDAAAATILEKRIESEAVEGSIATLSRKVSEAEILKQYPSLASVKSVNRDDPYMTVIRTNDVVINGVNLGEYQVSMKADQMLVVVKAKRNPQGIVHPNLYEEKGQWKWDLDNAKMKAMIEAMAGQQIHKAAAIVIDNLLDVPKDEVHEKRLQVLKEFIEKEASKDAAKEAKKAKKADPVVTEEPKKEEVKV